jgi:chromate transporter
VVGVILNLALFFAYHLLWPQGFDAALDVRSLLIAVGAAVALFKYKRKVMEVIGLCALVGLAVKLIPI